MAVCFDEELGDSPDPRWTQSEPGGWVVGDYRGDRALVSTNHGDDSSVRIELSLPVHPGRYEAFYSVDCDPGGDGLTLHDSQFPEDLNPFVWFSGRRREADLVRPIVRAQTLTLRLGYDKDGQGSQGEDRAAIRRLRILSATGVCPNLEDE